MIGLQWGLASVFDFTATGLVVGYVAGWTTYLSISLIGTWTQGEVIGDIPDPYFGSPAGFETVYQQLHASITGFAAQIPDLLGVDN